MRREGRRIIIVCNGTIRDKSFHVGLIKSADMIICADGGANILDALGITPNYLIGDMDSIKESLLKKFEKNQKTKVIVDVNQDKTDTELAIGLAQSFDPDEMILTGAIGTRVDHTFANILCLTKIDKKIKAAIIDEKQEIRLFEGTVQIKGKKDDIISVIPLTDIKGLTYNGFKWNLKNKDKKFGWFGICNRLTNDKGKICIKKGKTLIIKSKD